jgi:hypothetical protein
MSERREPAQRATPNPPSSAVRTPTEDGSGRSSATTATTGSDGLGVTCPDDGASDVVGADVLMGATNRIGPLSASCWAYAAVEVVAASATAIQIASDPCDKYEQITSLPRKPAVRQGLFYLPRRCGNIPGCQKHGSTPDERQNQQDR